MTFWIHKINWPKVLVSAAIFTVISMIVHHVEGFLTMQYYLMPQYFGVWSKLMMPTFLIFTFVTGISLAFVYYYVSELLPKRFWKRVTYFADLLIGTSFIFFT